MDFGGAERGAAAAPVLSWARVVRDNVVPLYLGGWHRAGAWVAPPPTASAAEGRGVSGGASSFFFSSSSSPAPPPSPSMLEQMCGGGVGGAAYGGGASGVQPGAVGAVLREYHMTPDDADVRLGMWSWRDLLSLAEALFPLIPLVARDVVDDLGRKIALCACAQAGTHKVAKWILKHHAEWDDCEDDKFPWKAHFFEDTVHSSLFLSCTFGHLDYSQWLVAECGATREMVLRDNNIYHEYRLSESRQLPRFLFDTVCQAGHLHVAKWLHETFSLQGDEIFSKNSFAAFALSCTEGHFEVAQWLFDTFRMSVDDKYLNESMSSLFWIILCQKENKPLAEWLWNIFGSKLNVPNQGMIAAAARSSGSIELLKWVITTFAVSREDTLTYGPSVNISQRVPEQDQQAIDLFLQSEFSCTQEELNQSADSGLTPFISSLLAWSGLCEASHIVACTCTKARIPSWYGSEAFGACHRGRPHTLLWLIKTFGEEMFARSAKEITDACISAECICMLNWVVDTFAVPQAVIEEKLEKSMFCRPHVLRWFLTKFPVRQDSYATNRILSSCFFSGDLSTAKWATKVLGLTKKTLLERKNSPSRTWSPLSACFGAEFWNMSQWAIKTFGITADDIRSHDNVVLQQCCAQNKLKSMKFLIQNYGITSHDIRRDDCMCFRLACYNGRREVLEYLTSTFGLTREDVCCVQNDALKYALRGGMEAVEYLITTYGITKDEFIACNCLGSIYRVEILQYVQRLFSFTKEEILSDEFTLFRRACDSGNHEMAEYILKTYKITKQDFDVTELIISLQRGDPSGNKWSSMVFWLSENFGVEIPRPPRPGEELNPPIVHKKDKCMIM
ncbi:hypothetical protein Pelo_6828 [Pelomyxa schiedti]|nr:hypothetical protein Pelo_6828 [Pelomyxa schiedti]